MQPQKQLSQQHEPAWLSANLGPEILVPNVLDMLYQTDAHDRITWRLPKLARTAGGVLTHCIKTVESLQAKHYPMIFKFGMTHDAARRWDNPQYGYMYEKDKWDAMCVLFLAPEKFTPAMLEAALIEKFQSRLPVLCITYVDRLSPYNARFICESQWPYSRASRRFLVSGNRNRVHKPNLSVAYT